MNASIAGKRFLITGGAGVVGSTIVDQLVEGGAAEVIVVDQFSRGRPANLAWAQANGNVTVIHNDLRDTVLLTRAICSNTPASAVASRAARYPSGSLNAMGRS